MGPLHLLSSSLALYFPSCVFIHSNDTHTHSHTLRPRNRPQLFLCSLQPLSVRFVICGSSDSAPERCFQMSLNWQNRIREKTIRNVLFFSYSTVMCCLNIALFVLFHLLFMLFINVIVGFYCFCLWSKMKASRSVVLQLATKVWGRSQGHWRIIIFISCTFNI